MKKLILFLLSSLTLHAADIDPRNACYEAVFQELKFKGGAAEVRTTMGTFTWKPKPFEKKMLNHWKKGDSLDFYMDEEQCRLFLQNTKSDVFYLPEVDFKSFPALATVELQEDKAVFTLTDGSSWISEDRAEMDHWQIGDTVIVVPTEGDEVEITDVDFIKEQRGDHWPIDARRWH